MSALPRGTQREGADAGIVRGIVSAVEVGGLFLCGGVVGVIREAQRTCIAPQAQRLAGQDQSRLFAVAKEA
jgi:hypothetical protein